jgi:hypothetical protein
MQAIGLLVLLQMRAHGGADQIWQLGQQLVGDHHAQAGFIQYRRERLRR